MRSVWQSLSMPRPSALLIETEMSLHCLQLNGHPRGIARIVFLLVTSLFYILFSFFFLEAGDHFQGIGWRFSMRFLQK